MVDEIKELPPPFLDLEEGLYNARDVLGMCRVYQVLGEALGRTGTLDVYAVDRQMAFLATQMTRTGMPIDLAERDRIGDKLRAVRDEAAEKLRPLTEGENQDKFLEWIAMYQAASIRKDDPQVGQLSDETGTVHSNESAFLARKGLRKAAFIAGIGKSALLQQVYDYFERGGECSQFELADKLGVAWKQLGNVFRSWGAKGILLVEKSSIKIQLPGEEKPVKRALYTAHKAPVPEDPEELEDHQDTIADAIGGINFGAKIQQAAILRVAGVPLTKLTPKTGLPKVGKETLEELAFHEAARNMLDWILTSATINNVIEGYPIGADGRLHPQWMIHKITGRWGSSPNCFDGDTEILTRDGWVKFSRLRKGAEVAQYWLAPQDVEHERIEFVQPTSRVKRRHHGELVKLDRRNIDLLVTPEHRLLLQRRYSDQWEDVLAKDFVPDRRMPIAGNFKFGHATPAQAWIQWICAAQADGSWNGSGWKFAFRRARKIKRLHQVLVALNLPFTEDRKIRALGFGSGRKGWVTTFYVKDCPVGRQAHALLGPKKLLGPWLLHWDRKSIEFFLHEIMEWDGSYTRKNCYSSSEKINADWVQTAFILTGRRARIRPYNGSPVQTRTNWQVDISSNATTMTTNTKVSRVPGRGRYVYCVNVPSSYIVVRRNGNVMITGNCQNVSKRAGGGRVNMRTMFVAPPGYIFVGGDFAQLEARIIAAASQDPFLLDIFATGQDIHSSLAGVAFPGVWPKLAETFATHKGKSCGPDPANPKSKCDFCKKRDKLRDLTKRLEYGAFYGGAADTLWKSVVKDFPDITIQQINEFLRVVGQRMAGVIKWRARELAAAEKTCEIKSPILGRRELFPLGRVEPTVAYNYIPQSGGADLWALGAIDFMERWDQFGSEDARICHNGHDSILILCKEEFADQVVKDMQECWTRSWNGVTFLIEADKGRRWSDT